MRTCGGERKLSRPIVRCQATSQTRPGKPSQPAPRARASAIVTGFGREGTCYPRRMSRPGQALVRLALLLTLASAAPVPAESAADRTNVPLKNWGGFSEFRDAVYDDLERLATAGLADRVLLNTKPLTRVEAAKIVARAIETIRGDDAGALNARRDLEPVLDRLMEEFRVELAALGARTSPDATAPGFFSFVPIDRAQTFGAWANRRFSLVDGQGRTFRRGATGGLTFESRAQIGDFLSLYLQPELLENEDYGAARLATGYAKLTFFNVELLVGRDSLAWGPGYHNGLLLTNNAAPLDQIKIGAAEPFLLPWISTWVGPMKVLMFLAQLEERRDHPYTKLSGMRLTFAPATFLELGASRTVLFDGLGPNLPLRKYPEAMFNPGFGDVRTRPEERNNSLTGLDADIRLRNLDRYFFPSRDLRLYGEFYWDDTCGECGPRTGVGHWFASNLLPKGSTTGGVGGVHPPELFGQDWLHPPVEYGP